MTRKEREQVVELLRCTADQCLLGTNPVPGLYSTAMDMGLLAPRRRFAAGVVAWRWAIKARNGVSAEGMQFGYGVDCLEAARRIEEGWTP